MYQKHWAIEKAVVMEMLQIIVLKPRKLDNENPQQSFKNWKNNAQKSSRQRENFLYRVEGNENNRENVDTELFMFQEGRDVKDKKK